MTPKETKTHELKTWPEYFKAVWDGKKTFELRKNDRDFNVGDDLMLIEYCPKKLVNTGSFLAVKITYILQGGNFGLEDGYVILGFNR